METHALPLSESEWAWLLPDRVRHTDPAEVVRERGTAHERDGRVRQPQAPGSGLGEIGHARRVLAQPRRLEARERGDGHEGGVDPLACDPDLRKRLGLDCLLPHARLVQLGEEIVEVRERELREPGLIRFARSTLDDTPCLVRASGGEEERDVPAHVQETHRQRDLVAAGIGKSLAVPAGEDVLERCLDARAEVEPPGEALRHFAHRRERVARTRAAGVGDDVLDHRGTNLGRAAGPDVGAVEREDLRRLGRVDEEERGSVLDVLAEQLRSLVPVRRAPGRVEERDVVRVGELLRRCSGELAEAHGEYGGAQRVLEWLTVPRSVASESAPTTSAARIGCSTDVGRPSPVP